jgi:cytochrome c biogenesis protein CcmG/thiol:disulfide interchange protein DsbE
MKRLVYAIPVLAFVALAIFLFRSLFAPAPDILPSALINLPAPEVRLPALPGERGFTRADLASGKVTVVNFFASWCAPCRQEAPVLMRLAKVPGVRLYGIDYKDKPEAARAFLTELGNPFARIVADRDGANAIDWGVYGYPETYVVDGKGIIRYKFIGPLSDAALTSTLLPVIEKAQANP